MMRDILCRLDNVIPNLQWEILDNPDLVPECVRSFLVYPRQ